MATTNKQTSRTDGIPCRTRGTEKQDHYTLAAPTAETAKVAPAVSNINSDSPRSLTTGNTSSVAEDTEIRRNARRKQCMRRMQILPVPPVPRLRLKLQRLSDTPKI